MAIERQQANLAAVSRLFAAWRKGEVGYDEFLAEDCTYQTAGFPSLEGRAAVLAFLFGGGVKKVAERFDNPRLLTIRRLDAEVLSQAATGDVVFTERVDHHYDATGVEVLTTPLAGVMQFDDRARCIAWRDYHDPSFLRGLPAGGLTNRTTFD